MASNVAPMAANRLRPVPWPKKKSGRRREKGKKKVDQDERPFVSRAIPRVRQRPSPVTTN